MKANVDYRPAMNFASVSALDDETLIRQTFAPVIAAYKQYSAQNADIGQFLASLTQGQKALMATWSFLVHAVRGTDEFHWRCLLFRHLPDRFQGMRNGLLLFGDAAMAAILDDIAAATHHVEPEGSMLGAGEARQLMESDSAYAASIIMLEQRLLDAWPNTVRRIAAFIRIQANDFIHMTSD